MIIQCTGYRIFYTLYTVLCNHFSHTVCSSFPRIVAFYILLSHCLLYGDPEGFLRLFIAGAACVLLWQALVPQSCEVLTVGGMHCILNCVWQCIIVDIDSLIHFRITLLINFSRSGQILSSVRHFCPTSGCIWYP